MRFTQAHHNVRPFQGISEVTKQIDYITDYITGEEIPNIGAEENRQAALKYIIERKGYEKQDITMDYDVTIVINDETYKTQLDAVVSVSDKPFMLLKCAPGNLGSRERETIAAARSAFSPPLPFCVVTDGKTALVLDVQNGKVSGKGLDAIPHKDEALEITEKMEEGILNIRIPDQKRLLQEKIVFRSYDSMNVNVRRNFE